MAKHMQYTYYVHNQGWQPTGLILCLLAESWTTKTLDNQTQIDCMYALLMNVVRDCRVSKVIINHPIVNLNHNLKLHVYKSMCASVYTDLQRTHQWVVDTTLLVSNMVVGVL